MKVAERLDSYPVSIYFAICRMRSNCRKGAEVQIYKEANGGRSTTWALGEQSAEQSIAAGAQSRQNLHPRSRSAKPKRRAQRAVC